MQNILFGAQNLSSINIVTNLAVAFLLSLIIGVVYKNTHRGMSYSQSFLFTIILGGMVISAVMMIIGNSLARAFGAFGAFSLIRFRTAVKDPKDMAYIFLVLAVGMAVGTNNYLIAFTITAFSLLVIIFLTKTNFGSIRKYDYILSFHFNTEQASSEVYKNIFDKFLKSNNVLHIDAQETAHILKLTFNIRFFDDDKNEQFIKEMSNNTAISNVSIINAKNDIEY